MPTPVKPIPDGYHAVTPYLTIRGASAAIDFYKKAFGAEEKVRMPGPDGNSVMHGEIAIGGSMIMLSDEFPERGVMSPTHYGGPTSSLMLYVPDADAVFRQAVAAGATALMPVTDMFWGDRMGQVLDPFGHKWSIATHTLDLTADEMQKAMEAAMASGGI